MKYFFVWEKKKQNVKWYKTLLVQDFNFIYDREIKKTHFQKLFFASQNRWTHEWIRKIKSMKSLLSMFRCMCCEFKVKKNVYGMFMCVQCIMIIKLFINRRSVGLFLFYGYNKNKICIDHCSLRTNLTFDFFSSCSSILKFEMKKKYTYTKHIYKLCTRSYEHKIQLFFFYFYWWKRVNVCVFIWFRVCFFVAFLFICLIQYDLFDSVLLWNIW